VRRDRIGEAVILQERERFAVALLIEVADECAHRGDGGRIIGRMRPIRCIQGEGFVSFTGARHRSYRDKVSPRIDINNIVRKAVAIEIGKRSGSTERGNPGRDAFEAGMHLTHELVRRMIGDLGQSKFFETKAACKRGNFR